MLSFIITFQCYVCMTINVETWTLRRPAGAQHFSAFKEQISAHVFYSSLLFSIFVSSSSFIFILQLVGFGLALKYTLKWSAILSFRTVRSETSTLLLMTRSRVWPCLCVRPFTCCLRWFLSKKDLKCFVLVFCFSSTQILKSPAKRMHCPASFKRLWSSFRNSLNLIKFPKGGRYTAMTRTGGSSSCTSCTATYSKCLGFSEDRMISWPWNFFLNKIATPPPLPLSSSVFFFPHTLKKWVLGILFSCLAFS